MAMTDRAPSPAGARLGLVRRLAALVLIVAVVGVPIDDLGRYAIVLASAVLLFVGAITARPVPWRFAVGLMAVMIAAQIAVAPSSIYVAAVGARDPLAAALACDPMVARGLMLAGATARYHLLAWLLTGIVTAVWFRQIAVAWMRRHRPDRWRRAARHPAVMHMAAWLAALQWGHDMRDQSPPVPAPAKA
jgi:hypothetical protein